MIDVIEHNQPVTQLRARPICNTIHPDDFVGIASGIELCKQAVGFFSGKGCRLEVPHPNRWWEYGTCLQILMDHYKEELSGKTILSVGSGWDVVGPALALMFDCQVVECEPISACREDRIKVNVTLKAAGKKEIIVVPNDLMSLPQGLFDAVLCVSVLEHVAVEQERMAWLHLADRVRPNGLLYLTMDCVPRPGRGYTYDNLRETNYTTSALAERIEAMCIGKGMTTLGPPDYEYHGNQVFDYTFFRVGFIKGALDASSSANYVERTMRNSGVRQSSGAALSGSRVRNTK